MIENPEISSNYLNSHTVNSTEKIMSKVHHPDINPNLVCLNTYTSIVVDEESDFEKDTHKKNDFRNMRRPKVVVNNFLENDKAVLKYPKHIPGNSLYAGITKDGKKVMILSDSIPSRIKMNEFNYYVKIGCVFRKSFPGATAKELAHYVILPLKEDKPDIVIINIGTNSLNKLDVRNITTDIFKLMSYVNHTEWIKYTFPELLIGNSMLRK